MLLRKVLFFVSAHGFVAFWFVANELFSAQKLPFLESYGPVTMLPSNRTLLPSFISQKVLLWETPSQDCRLLNVLWVTVKPRSLGEVRQPTWPGESGFSVPVGQFFPTQLHSQCQVTVLPLIVSTFAAP